METIFMNTKIRKKNETNKFVLNLLQRLDLRSSNNHFALQDFPIYYKWKNIRKKYKNNKIKIIVSTWNDEFELPDGSSISVRHSRLYRVHYKKTQNIAH